MLSPAPEHPLHASPAARWLRRLFPRAVFEIEAAAVVEAAEIRRNSHAIPSIGEAQMRERFGLCVDFSRSGRTRSVQDLNLSRT